MERRAIGLLFLVALGVWTCRRGGTTPPPILPPGDGDSGVTIRYEATVSYTVLPGDSLVVVLRFQDLSQGEPFLGMDRVWVEGDTLDDLGNGEFAWGPAPYRETLRVGFQDGRVQVDTFWVIPRRQAPVWQVPSGDTAIHEGDPLTLAVNPQGMLPLRWVITDAYGAVALVDTVHGDSTLALPDTVRGVPGVYKLLVEGWDTLGQDTVEAFVLYLRGGGIAGPLRLEVIPGPAGVQLVVDSVDPDPSDTLEVSSSWPVIRWTPETLGVERLVVVRWSGGSEAGLVWDVYGLLDDAGNIVPFLPPVYYGRSRSDYVADPPAPDSLTPGDTFQIRIEIGTSVIASTLYTP